jgi:hypothetical protein
MGLSVSWSCRYRLEPGFPVHRAAQILLRQKLLLIVAYSELNHILVKPASLTHPGADEIATGG